MASGSGSGSGRDKGKRPLSKVMSCFCFQPKSSASTSDSTGACRLMINYKSLRSKIGDGKYGKVYAGVVMTSDEMNEQHCGNLWFGDSLVGPIDVWTDVALKVLNSEGKKVISSWLPEVRSLGNLDSLHFVKLITITEYKNDCGQSFTVLVYEFMPNRSLKEKLLKKNRPCPLTWDMRLKIALVAAEGLLYLHKGMKPQMIYGDFKASNILLDKDFNPKLAFFGLSRNRKVVQSSADSEPDHLSAVSDVYMFGMVLYELLGGWPSVNTFAEEDEVLKLAHKLPKENDDFLVLMDTRLQEKFPKEAARQFAMLADYCLTENSRERPQMSEVVKILQQVIKDSEGNTAVSN